MYNEKIDDVIKSIKADASRTISKKIDALVEICDSQIERGSSDFSPATIGTLLGMREQSLRNDKRYKGIIDAFKEHHGSQLTASEKRSNSGTADWVNDIENSNSKWLVKDLIGENKRLKSGFNAQQARNAENKQLIDMRIQASGPTAIANALDKGEIEALMDFFSANNLKKLGLTPLENGKIVDTSKAKRAVTAVGFTHIINKLCGFDNQGNSLALGSPVKGKNND